MDPDYIILDNVFTEQWCTEFIEHYCGNELQVPPPDPFGQNKDRYARYDFVDKELAKQIHIVLTRYIDTTGTKVSHRFYMNKYYPNVSGIGKHVDGQITDSQGHPSVRTILIYLNACSGDTMLYNTNYSANVSPKPGRVLLLKQDVLHEGLPPSDTHKFILRTDLIKV